MKWSHCRTGRRRRGLQDETHSDFQKSLTPGTRFWLEVSGMGLLKTLTQRSDNHGHCDGHCQKRRRSHYSNRKTSHEIDDCEEDYGEDQVKDGLERGGVHLRST